jgi:hypothetical protein
MKKLIFAFLFLLMASSSTIFPQQKFFSQNKQNISQEPADMNNIFTRMEVVHQVDKGTITYYPINDGDFWEYIVEDTTTVFSVFYEGLYFSVVREVLNDTTMTNGLDYKVIQWEYIANSVSYEPWYDYHRVDTSGNVKLFFNNEDHLLFDLNSQKGTTYPSHLSGKFWRIEDRYNVIGFGDTLSAIDYALYEGSIIRETYTLVENFGIINYQKREYNFLPEGYFWGAVINNIKYGTLIAKKEEVDWEEFYPLHLGNYWVYEGSSGLIPILRTVRIVGDTTLQDGYEYKIAEGVHYSPNTGVNYYFTRIDSIGRIWIMETWAAEPTVRYPLSINVGDMNESYLFDFYWRIENKYIDIFLYPDVANHQISFSEGLGVTSITGEMTYEYLRGALINGTFYGDTIVTSIHDDIGSKMDFVLYPNYPNPFNSSTSISYSIAEAGFVSLKVFDILGQEVSALVNEDKDAGMYDVVFNASELTSGVYIYTLQVNGYSQSRKMILLR